MARPANSPLPSVTVSGPRAALKSPAEVRAAWRDAFRRVRAETEARAAHLSAEDQIGQSMADASPTKWHRAHTTWFFEQFLLVPHLRTYQIFDTEFAFLFNSYYVAAGPRHARPSPLVFRACPAVSAPRALSDFRSRFPLPVQFLLCRRRPPPRASETR